MRTVSPRLAIDGASVRPYLADAEMMIFDLRDDSPDFGRGLSASGIEGFKRRWRGLETVNNVVDREVLTKYRSVGHDRGKRYLCFLIVGGSIAAGDLATKVSVMAGTYERDRDGLPALDADGVPSSGGRTLRVDLTDADLDDWSAWHETGHCADQGFRSTVAAGKTGVARALWMRRSEAFADTFAALMTTRRDGDTRVARQVADLRILGTVLNGNRRSLGVFDKADGELLDSTGAKYHTTPAIDAAVAWIESVGIAALRAMPPGALVLKAQQLVEAHLPSGRDYALLERALLDTRFAKGEITVSPALPSALVGRFQAAARRLGFRPRPGDLVDPAAGAPLVTEGRRVAVPVGARTAAEEGAGPMASRPAG